MIVDNLALNISRIIGSIDNIKFWGIIPGYEELLSSFIYEMKRRRIIDYPDILKDANMAFL